MTLKEDAKSWNEYLYKGLMRYTQSDLDLALKSQKKKLFNDIMVAGVIDYDDYDNRSKRLKRIFEEIDET